MLCVFILKFQVDGEYCKRMSKVVPPLFLIVWSNRRKFCLGNVEGVFRIKGINK